MTHTEDPDTGPATAYRTVVADGLPELDQRLYDELDAFNAAATAGVAPSRELTGAADAHLRKEP